VFAEREANKFEPTGEEESCRTAIEAIKILSKWDKEKRG
jgi:hypothetical protein